MKRKVLRIIKWFAISVLSLMLLLTLIVYLNRDNICQSAIDGINEKLKSPLKVDEVELTFWSTFPNLSINLKNVFVAGVHYNKPSSDTLLYSKQIKLLLNPFDIWKENYEFKSIEINSGTIKLKVDKNGQENYDILKPEKSEDDKFNLNLKSVLLKQMKFSYENKSTNQSYFTKLEEFEFTGDFNEKKYKLSLHGDLLLNNLKSGQVNLIRNKKVTIDMSVDVNQLKNTINIPLSNVNISGLPFAIQGHISKNDYKVNIKTKEVQFKKLIESFNHNVTKDLASLKGNGEVYFDLLIRGDYNKKKVPKVQCYFGIKDGELTDPIKKSHIKNLQVKGSYSNDSCDLLLIDKIECITNSGSFNANLKISNFNNPHLTGHTNGKIHLGILSKMIPLPGVQYLNGKMGVNSDFDFVINQSDNEEKSVTINKVDGSFNLNEARIKFEEDSYAYENINASFLLNKKKIKLNEISLNIGESDMIISGIIDNVEGYFRNGVLGLDLKFKSNKLNVVDFYDSISSPSSKRNFVLPSDMKGKLNCIVDDFDFFGHSFKISEADLQLDKRELSISNFDVYHADASYSGDVVISENSPEIIKIESIISSKKINISPLMREWDNFYQSVLDSKNLQGDLKIKMKLLAYYDLRKGLMYDKVESDLDIKAKNLRLYKVESLESMGEYLNNPIARLTIGNENVNYIRNNLKDIKIPTINNKISIRNSKVIIPPMSVSSTFLDFTIQGEQAFNNEIDYLISFHLKDAFKKQQEDEFGEIVDQDDGTRVFLRIHGNIDDPKIEWDKQRHKKNAKKKRQEEKKTIKSMLKKDFGLYKNDTTVNEYIPDEEVKDQIEIDFEDKPDEKAQDSIKDKKPSKIKSKLNKLKNKLNKLGEEIKEEEEEEFDFD